MDAIGTLLYMCCRSFSSSSPAADSTDVPGVEVTDIASSSSAAAPADDDDTKKYDVFISFRDELVHILKCKERYGQMVIPVFYDINPSDVRKQHGSYADAFAQLEKRFDNNIYKVHKWREALTTAANLSGIDYSNKPGSIKNVVHRIFTKLIGESSCNLEGLFGIESHIEQIEELLGIQSQDACITVGIWGMGGIGKTTLAETNVRENLEKPNGLDHLVKTLLKEILKEENLSMESTFVQDRLRRTKVLIVLDDVSNSMQMQHLAGNRLRYGSGSRIIITSREEITNVEAIQVNWYNLQERPLKRADFKKMSNLIMLSSFGKLTASLDLPDSLVIFLRMPYSKVKNMPNLTLILVNLQVIYMDGSAYLTEVPNLSGSLKIVEITLRGCESLVEIHSYFQHLDLGDCRSLKYLPEMPGNIQYLNLECSGIKELPESVWSNKNISYLNLRQCKDLKILPSSKCKLKNLEKLDLNLCSKFENLPEVLEPMEHLKSLSLIETAKYLESEILKPMEHLGYLCLRCTAVEMLPSSIGNLNRLQDLNLSGCDQLKDVPTTICRLTNLKCLNFNGCWRLEKLPSSSVGFLSLEELDLSYSELPVLCNVKAQGCTSLKIVSSSRTALTQGWDKPNYGFKVFTSCPKLGNNARSNIIDEAQITTMRMATVAPFNYSSWLPNPWPQINIVCPGKEIPNWFSYQNEGSSVDIELCPDWFRTGLFGFALSVVVSGVSEVLYDLWLSCVRANFIVKFMGESHELFSSKYIIPGAIDDYRDSQHHVHVWNEASRSEEASVVFCPLDFASHMKVESCGTRPLYAEDAEKFKFGHVFMSRGPKVEEETRQDDDSKGGGSSDESEAIESD
ncbi:disease resistance protein [Pyrus ussuriensis x Pyrus communis]|uniref:ADP-ribosyl cyclase/cyclic ADP-ribose hydrolase n=1 Tax=Pyrus ussuriensis x Pyrus communis TaxID=2448454 RepID=A0A5N5HCY6_9ROSA|nr:disease resistance protein [Pyrus ussuriensis x Pyrus communis]